MGRHQPHLLIVTPDQGDVVPVDDATRRHLEKVLRVTSAVPVTYTDGKGLIGLGTYADGLVTRGEEEHRPRHRHLVVAVAPPHDNSRLRFLVEKLTELGVAELIWLDSAHRQGRPPRAEKTSSWIAGALEQSRGAWSMDVRGPVPLAEIAGIGTPVFADAGAPGISHLPHKSDLVLCVGPEGGFAADEIPAAALRLGLGVNILRTETAAIVGAALLLDAAG